MTKLFFIVGLPRSRTAWLANLFCHGDDVFCFHDARRTVATVDDMIASMRKGTMDYVGDSDNGLPLDMARALELAPEAPIAVIQRQPRAVHASLMKLHDDLSPTQGEKIVDATLKGLKIAMNSPNARAWTYDRLDDIEVLEAMWKHLVPDVDFPRPRAKAMQFFNVQMQIDNYLNSMNPAFSQRVMEEIGA